MDSGIGGLTVLKYLSPLYGAADFFYFSDGANLPYGSKDKNFLFLSPSAKSVCPSMIVSLATIQIKHSFIIWS